ncbi:toll/interleukin-1 receptor-like protein [Eucalyptus grandis]|uniref:toll/interleukin-1 receptor-like protein n=1 Tax=Eucalyptus grandis TaxID=71139 RepID=UPI00192F083F|nr:toll/interleukin-1 receptor-like protein [Eucalyptus grandis]
MRTLRGPDTRKIFANYLYNGLISAGIAVFTDDIDLDIRENITDALVQFIKQSKISIPILSQNYASNKYRLMELAQRVECQEAGAQMIMPIFYDVSPADLKYRRGCVGEAFSKHEDRVDRKDTNKWKQALEKIAEMKGMIWEIQT